MATARDIITAAYRVAGLQDVEESLDSASATHGVSALNRMMHGWKLKGADTEHVDLAIGDTFPLAQEFEEGTVYLLARRLSGTFQMPVGFDADAFFREIQAAYTALTDSTVDGGLLNMPSQKRYYY